MYLQYICFSQSSAVFTVIHLRWVVLTKRLSLFKGVFEVWLYWLCMMKGYVSVSYANNIWPMNYSCFEVHLKARYVNSNFEYVESQK